MLMPVQIMTHDGVARILEMPANGRMAKPAASISTPMATNIKMLFGSFV